MLHPNLPITRYPLPDATFPVVVYFFYPPSRRPSSRYLPFIGCPSGDTPCPSVTSYPVDVLCLGPLPSSHLFNHVCDLWFFSNTDVCVMSRYVMINILLSIFFVAAASLCFVCLVSVHVSTPHFIAGSTHLPCLSRSLVSLPWRSFCVIRTFLRLFDVTIFSRMIS